MRALQVSPHLDGFQIDGVAYRSDRFGVIHQENPKVEVTYDRAYVETRYDALEDKGRSMSLLRAGLIIGAIGVPVSVLDVGYGNGDFLSVMRWYTPECFGYDVSGYPLNAWCRQVDKGALVQELGLVTFFDSLEHIPDISFVSEMRARHVCISVPWRPPLEEFQQWKHRRPGEHLHHFDLDSLLAFMESADYRCLRACNVEDVIRTGPGERPNILTAIFEKRA